MTSIDTPDWSKLPAPEDDGATRHLPGSPLPSIELHATNGSLVDLSKMSGRTVVFAFPRTGRPGVENPPGWDQIPGARGCSPQSCSFRDRFAEFEKAGVRNIFGLSTQESAYQREAVERLHLPFPFLSDEHLQLTRALRLPNFEVAGMTLLKRFTLIIESGKIRHVFYPVFPPDQNASEVLQWIRAHEND